MYIILHSKGNLSSFKNTFENDFEPQGQYHSFLRNNSKVTLKPEIFFSNEHFTHIKLYFPFLFFKFKKTGIISTDYFMFQHFSQFCYVSLVVSFLVKLASDVKSTLAFYVIELLKNCSTSNLFAHTFTLQVNLKCKTS